MPQNSHPGWSGFLGARQRTPSPSKKRSEETRQVTSSRGLYPSQSNTNLRAPRRRPTPEWGDIRAQLSRCDHQITLALLWQEYKSEHPDGYQYSQFCYLYRRSPAPRRLSTSLSGRHVPPVQPSYNVKLGGNSIGEYEDLVSGTHSFLLIKSNVFSKFWRKASTEETTKF